MRVFGPARGQITLTAIFGVADFSKTTALMPESFSVGDGGFTGVGAGFPTGRNGGQAQLVDDLTWIHGRHTIKAGVNYRFDKITGGQIDSTGMGSSFSQSFPGVFRSPHPRILAGAFVQDEWKVRRNVALTLGFRVERDGNPACLDNCFARMNTRFGTSGCVAYNLAFGYGSQSFDRRYAVVADLTGRSPSSPTSIRMRWPARNLCLPFPRRTF